MCINIIILLMCGINNESNVCEMILIMKMIIIIINENIIIIIIMCGNV